MNYFFLNKHEDFARGTLHQFTHAGDGICAVAGSNFFFSRVFDAQQRQTAFHRMKFCVQMPDFGCDYTVRLYTSEVLPVWQNTQTPQDQLTAWQPYLAKTMHNHNDIFLFGLQGRYFWFCIEMHYQPLQSPQNADKPVLISDIFIYFDAQNLVRYLPEVYQDANANDGFLQRFLMIFQSFYEEIDAKIDQESHIYHAQSTDYLHFLAQLVGLQDVHIWDDDKLRSLLQNVKHLYQIRGTRAGLLQLVSLFTEGGAFVYEDKQDGAPCVHILIQESHFKEQNTLRKIVQNALPVGIAYRITVLKDHTLVGGSTYLGINTKLIQYEQMGLTGTSRLNYTILGQQQSALEEHS